MIGSKPLTASSVSGSHSVWLFTPQGRRLSSVPFVAAVAVPMHRLLSWPYGVNSYSYIWYPGQFLASAVGTRPSSHNWVVVPSSRDLKSSPLKFELPASETTDRSEEHTSELQSLR